MNWSELVAPDIGGLTPYKAGITSAQLKRDFALQEVYKFNSNESPIEPSPKVIEAISLAARSGQRYPDYFELIAALAEHIQVKPAQVVLGNGSIDVIELACRLVAQSGKNLVCSEYGYSAYQLLSAACGLAVKQVSSDENYGHDIRELIAACDEHTAVLVVDSPTNMAGQSLDLESLHKMIDSVPSSTLIILDQAYIEFTSGDLEKQSIGLIEQYPNLLITRTFSKAFGLAGLRVGYGVANEELISWISRIQRPFPVSGIGVAAAISALSDTQYTSEILASILSGRQQLYDGLGQLGIKCSQGSQGNFVFAHIGTEQPNVVKALLQRGYIVRPMNSYNMPECVRISVASHDDNQRLLSILGELV